VSAGATNPKQVLMVLYYYHPYKSGLSAYAKNLAEGLVRSGYKVTVLTSRHDRTLPKTDTVNGVKILRRPVLLRLGKGVIMPTFWLDIIWHARRADVVNPHLPIADTGLSSLFIPRHKQVTTYHCDINLGDGLADRAITAVSLGLMRLQLGRSRVVVASSRDYLAHSKMSRYIGKTTQIYPPIAEAEFHPADAAPLFKRLGLREKSVKIGFVGRIVFEKGINYLLQSIPHLTKSLPDYEIIIVGDYQNIAGGSIKDQLDDYLERWPGQVTFTGFLADHEVAQFYTGIDVLVLPSIDPLEAFGMVQVEALLCGTPVVASDLPGVREVVKRTGYGRICKIKDPADIAQQIVSVVNDPRAYRPERSKVVEIFGADKTIAKYRGLMH
jgi:glycosyltransferase involved in cell wall biosynthesis